MVADPDFSIAVSKSPDGSLVEIWAVPGASRTQITGLHDGAVRIRVSAPPEGGKANRVLTSVLATVTGAEVELVGGRTSRRKRFLIRHMDPVTLANLISEHSA